MACVASGVCSRRINGFLARRGSLSNVWRHQCVGMPQRTFKSQRPGALVACCLNGVAVRQLSLSSAAASGMA